MKFLKNAAIRLTALLLLFAMIAAVVLYQAGAYDLVFIKRPAVDRPEDSGSESDEPDRPSDSTGSSEPNPDDTSDEPPLEPRPSVDLEEIPSLSEAEKLGYSLSSALFDGNSMLARLPYDFGKKASTFSLRTEKITSTVFYQTNSGLISTKKVTSVVDKPRVSLYFGLLLVDNGKTLDIYNLNGKKLVSNFSGTLTYALSENGNPVVKIKSKYHEIDAKDGLSKAISEDEVCFRALSFDHPRYDGAGLPDLKPYSAYVDVYTEVTLEDDQTDPSETTPGDTETDDTTTGADDTTTEADDTTTEADDTTSEADDTTSEADDTTSEADDTTTEADDTTTEADDTTSEADDTTSEADDTTSGAGEPAIVITETIAENPAEASEDVSEDTLDTDDKPLPEGVVEIDGKYYKVTKKLMWGYRHSNGEVAIPSQYASAYAFTEDGLAAVTDFDDNVFYINTEGEEVISIRDTVHINPPEMSGIRIRQFYFEPVTKGLESIGTYYFDHGYTMLRYCWVSNFNKKQLYRNEFRLIDTKGKQFEIPGGYTLVGYSDGVLLLEKEGAYGYMNTKGAWVSPAVYQKASPFLQGLGVAVNAEGKYGLIDRSGSEILPFAFDYISNVSGGKVVTFSADRGWEIYGVVAK
ncbi:MAG: WG repeat-containing protein [Ruminococcaceae bacterium]|nr:WG repeat-containing protein [Oscillospiraceae bacterium]